MKLASLTLLFFFLYTSHFVSAQEFWEPLYGPKGININEMELTIDGTLYLTRGDGVIWKSINAGQTMEPLSAGLPPSLYNAQNLKTDSFGRLFFNVRCYDPQEEGIYKLNSTGDGFEMIQQGVWDMDINPADELFLISQFGVLKKSTDGGLNFETLSSSAPGMSHPPGDLWALGNGFVYLYDVNSNAANRFYRIANDGSAQLELFVDNPPYSMQIEDAISHPSGQIFALSYGLARSSNNGSTWEIIDMEPYISNGEFIRKMYINEDGRIYVVGDHNIAYSDDVGNTWQKAAFPYNNRMNAIDYMAENNGQIFFYNFECANRVFVRSDDGGNSWEDLWESYDQPVFSLFREAQGNLFIKTCPSYDRSWDGSATWDQFEINGDFVSNIITAPNGLIYAQTTNDRLYRSFDGSISWTDVSPTNIPDYYPIFISPENEVYAWGYKSDDNGETWTHLPEMQELSFYDMAFHPNGHIYGLHEGIWVPQTLYRSEDGGVSWQEVTTDLTQASSMHINNKGHIYIKGFLSPSLGVFVSQDEFQTLELSLETDDDCTFISDLDGDVFISQDDGIYTTEDDGVSWYKPGAGFPGPTNINGMSIDKDQHLLVGSDRIYRSLEPISNFKRVNGKVWFDENDDCTFDSSELLIKNWLVHAEGGSHFSGISDSLGTYSLSLPIDSFRLEIEEINSLWEAACANNVTVDLNTSSDTVEIDFPIRAADLCPVLELDIGVPFLRRCFSNTYHIHYCNKGTAVATNTSIKMLFDPYFIIESATAPILSQNGNEYIFDTGDLDILECGDFKITFAIDCDAPLGTEHCTEAILDPGCNGLETTDSECRINIGAFDPNDKSAFVDGRAAAEWIPNNTAIAYLVRFQNTGTDTAFNVVIEDRLSYLLEGSSVKPGTSSHPYTWDIDDTGLLRFSFADIMLPDSNVNEAASHGFVKFTIDQKPDLPDGLVIHNRAGIYFDFNEPVITNNVSILIGEPVSVFEKFSNQLAINTYPNPFSDQLNISFPADDRSKHQLMVFDLNGQLQLKTSFDGGAYQLNINELQSGLYILMILDKKGLIGTAKVIAQ